MIAPHASQRAYLYGQAPGIQEGSRAATVAGARRQDAATLARNGGEEVLRHVLLRVGDPVLSRPGSIRARRPDADAGRAAAVRLLARVGDRLLRPRLVVTVGGLAARRLLGVTSVTEAVGATFDVGGILAIPLPHPSGASGWLNLPENRARVAEAAERVRVELARLGDA